MRRLSIGFAAVLVLATLSLATSVAAQPQEKEPINMDRVIAIATQKGQAVGLTGLDIEKLKEAAKNGPDAAERRFPKEKKSPASDQLFGRDRVEAMDRMPPEQREAAVKAAFNDPATKAKAEKLPREMPANAKPSDKRPW